jgi:hypothetical protein
MLDRENESITRMKEGLAWISQLQKELETTLPRKATE